MRLLLALALLLAAGLLPAAARACDGRLVEGPEILGTPLCLPAAPQRIAVLDPAFSLGMALELDLPVVAAPMTRMSDAALRGTAEARGVADIGFVWQPSVEALVAARPDLIIGSIYAESHYPTLSQIAPTALIRSPDWRDYYRTLARITGQEDRLAGLFAPLDARITAMRPRVPDTPVSILRITPWDFQVYLDSPAAYAPFAILREAGVRRSAYETATGMETVRRPDWEELGGLDAPQLLVIIGGMNDSATSGRYEEVTGNPLWQLLPAVQAGAVHRIDPGVWMEFSGIAAAHRVLDDVERFVIGAMTRDLRALLLMAAGVAALAVWAMTVGTAPIPLSRVAAALWQGGSAREDLLVLTVRLPRVLAGLAIGAALAAAGALLQAVTRNPLAEPGLLGINAGAAFAAVLMLVLGPAGAQAGGRGLLVAAACLGAGAAAILVQLLGSLGRQGPTPLRLTLAGVVIGSFLAALTGAMLIFDAATLDVVRVWTAGSLAGARMAELRPLLPLLALGLVAVLATRRQIAVLGLGPEVARSLGLEARVWWPVSVAMVAVLAGGSVALAGPVGFAGLIVPHAVRLIRGRITGALPFVILAGAGTVVLADALPRALAGRDVPVGVSLAFLGGPVFLWFAIRTGRGG